MKSESQEVIDYLEQQKTEISQLRAELEAERKKSAGKSLALSATEAVFGEITKNLTDTLDLNRDEFKRIEVECKSGQFTEVTASCIIQLCERSQSRITQNVSVIQQRDNAEKDAANLSRALRQCVEALETAERIVYTAIEYSNDGDHSRITSAITAAKEALK